MNQGTNHDGAVRHADGDGAVPGEPVREEARTERVRGPRIARGALVFAATTALAVGAAATFAASPTDDPAASPDATTETTEEGDRLWSAPFGEMGPRGLFGQVRGHVAMHLGGAFQITIASIDGAQLALETDNGWTRTVDATGVTITRGEDEIALSDLAAGEQVVLQEERADDGTWTLTGIHVVQPHAGGIVTAVDGDTITVEGPQGISTIRVTPETTYTIRGGEDASLQDVAVDEMVMARGTRADDGALVATDVWISAFPVGEMLDRMEDGPFGRFEHHFGDGGRGMPWLPDGSDGTTDDDADSGSEETDSGADS
jgi:hypothetical protein